MTQMQSEPRTTAAATTRRSRATAVWRRAVWTAVGPLMKARQRARRAQLAELAVATDSILFIGDSITEEGVWDEWFPELRTANRGVGGETTAEILERIDGAISSPRAVLILAGTNDIASGVSTATIVENIGRIVSRIHTLAPGTPVVVQSIMPRTALFRDEIILVDELLRGLVASADEHVSYLDLWPALASPAGTLRAEFTEDRLHLNGAGYRAWVEVLRPVVSSLPGADRS